jgi:hypothetical protein
VIDEEGVIRESVTYRTDDGALEIEIGAGTTALKADGEPLQAITVKMVCDNIPPPPVGAYIIGCVYDLGPDGATFDPPITVRLYYDPDKVPEGIAEKDLVIAYYNVSTQQWVVLPSTVDTDTHTITAETDHLTLFAVYAEAAAGGPEGEAGTSIWIIVGPVIAVIVLGIVAYWLLKRKRPQGPVGAKLD